MMLKVFPIKTKKKNRGQVKSGNRMENRFEIFHNKFFLPERL